MFVFSTVIGYCILDSPCISEHPTYYIGNSVCSHSLSLECDAVCTAGPQNLWKEVSSESIYLQH